MLNNLEQISNLGIVQAYQAGLHVVLLLAPPPWASATQTGFDRSLSPFQFVQETYEVHMQHHNVTAPHHLLLDSNCSC